MARKNAVVIAGLMVMVILIIINRQPEPGSEYDPVKRQQLAMGTFVDIEVRDTEPAIANAAIDSAFAEVLRLHNDFSPFNEEGPLWRINHSEDSPVPITAELLQLLQLCDTINTDTEGAFDPALEALISLWKIWGEEPVLPTPEEVAAALALSGWEKISFDEQLQLHREPGIMLSFGAVVKGYGADRAIEILAGQGVAQALVNLGGEIRTLGDGWNIGIQHPSLPQEMLTTIALEDQAVATSGDYEQYHEQKGRRYHHILDPATGYPATASHSVTIVAPTCIKADAYATGVFVLGPERGMALVERLPQLEGMLLDSAGVVHYSSGFEELVVE